jgi:hypothetical protein
MLRQYHELVPLSQIENVLIKDLILFEKLEDYERCGLIRDLLEDLQPRLQYFS